MIRWGKEDVKDPVGRLGWPLEKGRDGERTPMQWDDTANAGFTRRTPWLPLPPSYKTHSVATEAKDPKSVLSFYKQLQAVRRHSPALLGGEYIAIHQNDPNLPAYLRRSANQTVLVVLNMSAASQTVKFDFLTAGLFFCEGSPIAEHCGHGS
jgi:alpha-glucosidase